jgi:hypothetical protein
MPQHKCYALVVTAFAATCWQIVVGFLVGGEVIGVIASHIDDLPNFVDVSLFGSESHRQVLAWDIQAGGFHTFYMLHCALDAGFTFITICAGMNGDRRKLGWLLGISNTGGEKKRAEKGKQEEIYVLFHRFQIEVNHIMLCTFFEDQLPISQRRPV